MTDFLPHKVITDLGDAQENFAAIDGHVLQVESSLSDVASVAQAQSNLGILGGTVTVAFSASALSSAVSIVHNLGRVPTVLLASILGGDPGVTITHFLKNNASTTTATIQARAATASTMNVTYSWLVVG